MKLARIICLLLVSILALSPVGSVLAQEGEGKLALTPNDGRYSTIIVAGRDKIVTFTLENPGTAAVSNIVLSSEEPDGWDVKFSPDKVVSLEAGENERIDVTIEVPENAQEGDYMVTLNVAGDEGLSDNLDYRVTVNVPIREPKIEMRPIYPRLEAIAGEEFVFEVEFLYTAATITAEPVVFNLVTTVPPGWDMYMTPPYEKEKKLSAISLKPGFTFSDKTRVVVTSPFLPSLPDPGEYKVTLEAVDETGNLRDSVDFTAVITARYDLRLTPAGERYDTTTKAGRENFFSIIVTNLGTGAIDNINFSSDHPQGWTIEFAQEKVDSMDALTRQTIDVNIKPPPETIAGDYSITLKALGTQASARNMEIRVTVESPTIWGWVGVGIIMLVIAGLVGIFMRFSRR